MARWLSGISSISLTLSVRDGEMTGTPCCSRKSDHASWRNRENSGHTESCSPPRQPAAAADAATRHCALPPDPETCGRTVREPNQ